MNPFLSISDSPSFLSSGVRSHSLGTTPSSFSSSSPFFSIPGSVTSQWPGSSQVRGAFDTSTLAAHDFDVDNRTGFMPPHPPTQPFPSSHSIWEQTLDRAVSAKLKLGDSPEAQRWRETAVLCMPTLEVSDEIRSSEILLRRGHKVLAWIMHFYIQTLPDSAPVTIPATIAIPLLNISQILDMPPVLTYSDDVLYNWTLADSDEEHGPGLPHLECIHTFTSTPSEAHFYLTSAYMELHGVSALSLMRLTLDEVFVSDILAFKRITVYLERLATVIEELERILVDVKKGCDPEVFYHEIRPWFKGEDSNEGKKWHFEGVDEQPKELSGPSAGQSSLIHSLDVFLGVGSDGFRDRMKGYMPRRHRTFLGRLEGVRELVMKVSAELEESEDDADTKRELVDSYNLAVNALKTLRDAHYKVVAMYIIGPAAREKRDMEVKEKAARGVTNQIMESSNGELKGTGGSELSTFLKSVRTRTEEAII